MSVESTPQQQQQQLKPPPSSAGLLSPRPRTADAHSNAPPPPLASSRDSIQSCESWTTPEDGEGDFVRRTYLHFDRTGIQGDGTVQGEEWTRNRSVGALAPWQQPPLPNGNPTQRPRRRRTKSTPAHGSMLAKPTAEAAKSSPLAASQPITAASPDETLPDDDDEQGVTEENGGDSSSLASATEWPDLDRYGFFGGRDWDSHSATGRIVVLPAACYDFVPSPSTSASSSKGKTKVKSAAKKAKKSLSRTGVAKQSCTGLPASMSGSGEDAWGAGASTSAAAVAGPSNGHTTNGKARAEDVAPSEDVITSLRLPSESLGRSKEQTRIDKWSAMLAPVAKEGGNTTSYRLTGEAVRDRDRLERRIYKGIPDRWRAAAWWALLHQQSTSTSTGSYEGRSRAPSRQVSRQQVTTDTSHRPSITPSASVSSHLAQAHSEYAHLLTLPSPHTVQIDLDVPRTISNHVLFRTRYGWGQVRLFKLLHAYSLGCQDCGYCQGMGGIAVVMVSLFSEEEKSWAVLRRLHDGPSPTPTSTPPSSALHRLFSPGFPLLLELFHVQSALLRVLFPQFATILEDQGVEASSYATRWYMTCFYGVLPWQTCLRVWDVLMWEEGGISGGGGEGGMEMVLPLVGMAILWAVGHRVVTAGSTTWDFEPLLSLLSSSNLFVPQDDDALLFWIRGLRNDAKVRRVMREAAEEWRRTGGAL